MKNFSTVAVFGPHDRNNYGDFLFPLMLDYALSKCNNDSIILNKYSIVKSDFSSIGAYSSKSYKQLMKDVDKGKIKTIIIAGGESLGVTWARLYAFINTPYFYLYEHSRFGTKKIVLNTVKFMLGARYECPFAVKKQNDLKIIYNSIGGGFYATPENLERLEEADYIAARDKAGFDLLKTNLKNSKVYNAPDSAILLSDVFVKDNLPNAFKLAKFNSSDKYLFFQISKYKHQKSINEIVNQFETIFETTDLKLVLCPIGLAKGHEDDVPLKEIFEALTPKYTSRIVLVNKPNIYDIMALIANAEAYIGSSLHGVITAMSYGVPYLGINPSQLKVVDYIQTWGGFDGSFVCNSYDFVDKLKYIMTNAASIRQSILETTESQKVSYYASAARINEIISQ